MKPVKWMDKYGVASDYKSDSYNIPLYTAPRELSDEEIGELFSKYGEKDKWFDFARAILKKASEK